MKKITLLILSLASLVFLSLPGALSNKAQAQFCWAKQLGGTGFGYSYAYSIAVDPVGNVYTTGYFAGIADFDPGAGTFNLNSGGGWDIFISKLDASGNFLWAKQMAGTNLAYGYSIAVDGAGNVYTTGYFDGTVDFDPGAGTFNLISAGFEDIFISKLDASGNFLWAKSMGGTGNDDGYSIALDALGNIYTTGYFDGTADFDPGTGTFNLTTAGTYDIFVSKLDASGNFLWAKQMAGTNLAYGYSIAVDGAGNVYTTGRFDGTVDFDPGMGTFNLTSAGANDVFVSKLDASGNFIWSGRMGGTGNDWGYSIALDASGNIYTTGFFQGTADFDPGPGTFNLTETGTNTYIFVSKLDASGNFLWAKQMSSASSNGIGYSISVDGSGNVYTTGRFYGTADFDPGAGTFNLTSAGDDVFVSKLDASGNFLWAKQMGGTSDDHGYSITLDGAGNVFTTGYFNGTADFDPGAGTFNLTADTIDIFISKISSMSVAFSVTNVSCYGGSDGSAAAIVSGGTPPYTYLWSSGQTTSAVSNLTAGNYTVTVNDSISCASMATMSITQPPLIPAIPICLVTVDSLSQNNVIVWDKTLSPSADTFLIYRDTANNAYGLIGKVPYDSLSWFIDTVRTLYAANGNPNFSSWRYKLAVKDTCGNVSAMGPYHQSLFMQNNSGNFNWTDYKIEGQTIPIPSLQNYLFQRDDISSGNYATIATLSASSTLFTDPQYATYQSTATWRVITAWSISCTPTIKNPVPNATTINSTKSNTFKTGVVNVNETSIENLVSIYPNPTNGEFKVQSSESKIQSLEIENIVGEKIYSQIINNKSHIVHLNVSNGIYFFKIISDKGTVNKKIVINR